MGWRDFKLPTPIDIIDINDKNQEVVIFVDKVDIVDRIRLVEEAPASPERNPFPEASPEAHRATLEVVMGDMVQTTCDRIIEEHRKRGISAYKSTPENQWAEKEITRVYHAVLDGMANIEDYKESCDDWLKAAISAVENAGASGNSLINKF